MSLEGRRKKKNKNPIIGGVHLQDKNLRPKHVDLMGESYHLLQKGQKHR